MIRVSGLYIYPVKSCRGIALGEAEVGDRGFVHDREWLVVDRRGTFMTQRDWPALARVTASPRGDGLVLEAEGMPVLEANADASTGDGRQVTIWQDACVAQSAGTEAAQWISAFLGTDCELVRMSTSTLRQVDLEFAETGDRVGFADGFPFLLISEGSLDELNCRLPDGQHVPMDRFRPNIVVTGCAPYSEDEWSMIRIGDVGFRIVKPCARCVITTTDQRTGERSREPLKTLATYRLVDGNVMFGQNLIHASRGVVRVGDSCEVEI